MRAHRMRAHKTLHLVCPFHGSSDVRKSNIRVLDGTEDGRYWAIILCRLPSTIDPGGCVYDLEVNAEMATDFVRNGAQDVAFRLSGEVDEFTARCSSHCPPCAMRDHDGCRGGECRCPSVRCAGKNALSRKETSK